MIYRDSDHLKRSMRSFTAFLVENSQIMRDGKFICDACRGSGSVVPDHIQADPVEGHKLSPRTACSACSGTGNWSERQWRVYFKEFRHRYRAAEQATNASKLLVKKALSKLTDDEKAALGLEDRA